MANDSTSRLTLAWNAVRDSLWFAPSTAAILGVLLSVVAPRIPVPDGDGALLEAWIYSGGTDGARAVLSTIAGSLITVTGVIFSVTIVALQLASSQFTPRVVGSFVADRVNQVVLGVFIGTFTYTLLVLRTIQSEGDDRATFVPHVAVTIALVLLLVSIGALIVFINHAARSIQASTILDRETARTRRSIERLFPARVGEPTDAPAAAPAPVPATLPAVVAAEAAGYLQALHAEPLWALGGEVAEPLVIRMELHLGAFVFPGCALASVWPATACDERVADAVRAAFLLGAERTAEQDVELGLVELSDIALRALSPGINDPTTAIHAIDRLTELLAALAARRPPDPVRTSDDGRVRLLARDTSFERAVSVAFDQIRHYGAGDPAVALKLLEALRELALVVPPPLRPPLATQAQRVHHAARRALHDPADHAALDRVAAEVHAAVYAAAHAAAPPRA